LVAHGSGLDEVAIHGPTQAVRLADGEIEAITFTPEEAGLQVGAKDSAKGGGPEENAARLKALLQGRGSKGETDLVAINAGALLITAGLAATIREGTELALDALATGRAGQVLDAYIEASNG
jgi:anthranilate phosphoribosyltransferase